MNQINLLPERFARERAARRTRRRMALATIAVGIAGALAAGDFCHRHEQLRWNAKAAEARLRELEPAFLQVQQLDRDFQKAERELKLVDGAAAKSPAAAVVALICHLAPEKIELTSLSIDSPADRPAPSPVQVSGAARDAVPRAVPVGAHVQISGRSKGGESLWRFMKTLSESHAVASAALANSLERRADERGVVEFKIVVELMPQATFVVAAGVAHGE
ncbi:MAG: hypothetical protein NTW19_21425 [Planctomycetota bacterium]|nr:hypothetical protein [Planctomycetota bacterium]